MPMGFCYPGKGKSGDLPPRKECAPQWHELLLAGMAGIKLILLVGLYSQRYYLKNGYRSLTENVKKHTEFLPLHFPLPHPSPRNRAWLKNNQWFSNEVLPVLKTQLKSSLHCCDIFS